MLTDKCKPKHNCEAFKELQAKCEYLEKQLLAMRNCQNCLYAHGYHYACEGCNGVSNWQARMHNETK